MSSNLKRRHKTWYVRVGVNPKHRAAIGKSEIVRSLKTHDRRVAERIKNGVIQEIKDGIQLQVEAAGIQPSDPRWYQNLARELRVEVAAGNMATDEAGVILDDARETYMKANFTRRELREYEEADEAARMEGQPRPEILSGRQLESMRIATRLVAEPDFLPLSDAIKQYLHSIEARVTPSTWKKKESILTEFKEWSDDPPVADLDRRQAGRYVLKVLLPNARASRTNIGAVHALSTFYKWLATHGLVTGDNPFEGQSSALRESSRGAVDSSYRAWTKKELGSLFDHFDTLRPNTVKAHAGTAARISLYTGMRQEEICSLKLDAVNLDERMLSVADGKTASSVRQVYIPDQLLPMITELVDTSDDDFMIAGLKPGGRDLKRSHALGNRFSEIKSKLFPKAGRNLAFHGLRSTYVTAAESSGIPESTAKLLVGHARQSLTYGLYSKGANFDLLSKDAQSVADWIEKNLYA